MKHLRQRFWFVADVSEHSTGQGVTTESPHSLEWSTRFVLRVLVTVKMLVAISVACLVAASADLPSPWSPPPGPRADRREELHGSGVTSAASCFTSKRSSRPNRKVGACAYVQLASRSP